MGKPGTGKGIVTGRRKSRVSGAPEVLGEFPMSCLAEEIQTPGEGQVKALITDSEQSSAFIAAMASALRPQWTSWNSW